MKVAFLVGSDSAPIRRCVESVSRVEGVEPVALLLDVAQPALRRRWRNLRRNVKREGLTYVIHRVFEFIADWLDRRAAHFEPHGAAESLLRSAFPQAAMSLEEIARQGGFPIVPIENLNSPKAAAALRRSGAQLGIVVGTRILRKSTFTVPELGCINLHKGEVPEYRGQPPGFWELYDGAPHAGITVHFIDAGVDTGDIVGTSKVPIHSNETELSLETKLHAEGAALLARCVGSIANGQVTRTPQISKEVKARTNPTRKQRKELRCRRPYLPPGPSLAVRIVKTAFHLALFYLGIYHLCRKIRHLTSRSRASIILYHRVQDDFEDNLSASTERFARHVAMLRQRYTIQTSSWLLDRLEKRERIPPDTVVLHFDDCYRDKRTIAAPILDAAGVSATFFLSSGFIGTSRRFEHDDGSSPFVYENLTPDDVRELSRMGFEIGAHSVNHADLGRATSSELELEVLQSRTDLERILEKPVNLFSYPFGGVSNITPEARSFVADAGFRALFSAHGGTVTPQSNRFDVPRQGSGFELRCLDLMMQIEGISLRDWYRRILGRNSSATS